MNTVIRLAVCFIVQLLFILDFTVWSFVPDQFERNKIRRCIYFCGDLFLIPLVFVGELPYEELGEGAVVLVSAIFLFYCGQWCFFRRRLKK